MSIPRAVRENIERKQRQADDANSTRAVRETQEGGYVNAIPADSEGNVAELASPKLFLVTASAVVVTPVANGTFLARSRARVIALLVEVGVAVDERTVKPFDILPALKGGVSRSKSDELDRAVEMSSTGNYGIVTPCLR
jgi:branched-chain amino acid aminotransferase